MSTQFEETVIAVEHWTESLFSFRTTRNAAFRFRSGQFTMIGLANQERPVMRAYSLANASYDGELEFFSIKVADGPLTSKLQKLVPGDHIVVGRKATGTLILDNLTEGRHLYLLSTGTGLAPFLSIIREPETYERFERVVLVHGCRQVADLAYGDRTIRELREHELLGDMVRSRLAYHPTVTREPFRNRGRVTDLLSSGELCGAAGMPPIDPRNDRFMLCGSPSMLAELKGLLMDRGFSEGNSGEPAEFVIERAFVER